MKNLILILSLLAAGNAVAASNPEPLTASQGGNAGHGLSLPGFACEDSMCATNMSSVDINAATNPTAAASSSGSSGSSDGTN